MKKGFTLIELLIVVAIIAILAAIAVPNFLEAQTRAKVSRVKNDQRSLATAIETYYLDNNTYPVAWRTGFNSGVSTTIADAVTFSDNVSSILVAPSNATPTIYRGVWSFAQRNTAGNGQIAMLTTPISYITSFFPDPFQDAKAASFCYWKDNAGWLLWSPGPDADMAQTTDLGNLSGTKAMAETAYDSGFAQPSVVMLCGPGFTYDSTNGTVSNGDVWRVKQ